MSPSDHLGTEILDEVKAILAYLDNPVFDSVQVENQVWRQLRKVDIKLGKSSLVILHFRSNEEGAKV